MATVTEPAPNKTDDPDIQKPDENTPDDQNEQDNENEPFAGAENIMPPDEGKPKGNKGGQGNKTQKKASKKKSPHKLGIVQITKEFDNYRFHDKLGIITGVEDGAMDQRAPEDGVIVNVFIPNAADTGGYERKMLLGVDCKKVGTALCVPS